MYGKNKTIFHKDLMMKLRNALFIQLFVSEKNDYLNGKF